MRSFHASCFAAAKTSGLARHFIAAYTFEKSMRKRILIVDDQTDYGLLSRALPEYEVRVESNASLAVATAKEFRPHLFLLDMVMPEMHGTVLAEQIRKEECLRKIPIVFVSAMVFSNRSEDKIVQIGGYPALGKPFSVEELKRCIFREIEGFRPTEPLSPGVLAGS